MFEVGDYVVYGSSGVCKVENIGQLEMSGVAKDRLYYTLSQLYVTGGKVFTPVDSDKVVMRALLSKDEAKALISSVDEMDSTWVTVDKQREEIYKKAIRTCDCKELLRIIKMAYINKRKRMEQGKKMIALDERYLRMAEDKLYGELAICLGEERDQIRGRFLEILRDKSPSIH